MCFFFNPELFILGHGLETGGGVLRHLPQEEPRVRDQRLPLRVLVHDHAALHLRVRHGLRNEEAAQGTHTHTYTHTYTGTYIHTHMDTPTHPPATGKYSPACSQAHCGPGETFTFRPAQPKSDGKSERALSALATFR